MEQFVANDRGVVRQTLEGYLAFYPSLLPRDLMYSHDVVSLLDEATGSLHRLAGIGRLLPNPALLIGPHVRLEAVLSSRIEGTRSDMDDLLLYETSSEEVRSGELYDDVKEVNNYLLALNHGLELLESGLPLSIRLIKAVHETLMTGVRGNHATPGEFRRTQNWIGGRSPSDATFVPPPVDAMRVALTDWEKFLHERPFPLLLQLALLHYQFEVIHPFLDGNGRLGRLLIPLVLCERRILPQPLLYLSAYFERNRSSYYDHLLNVSRTGESEGWLKFFLEGVRVQATDAENRTVRLVELQKTLRDELHEARANANVLRLADHLFSSPYVTTKVVQKLLGVSFPTAKAALESLVERGHLQATTHSGRSKIYLAPHIFNALYRQ